MKHSITYCVHTLISHTSKIQQDAWTFVSYMCAEECELPSIQCKQIGITPIDSVPLAKFPIESTVMHSCLRCCSLFAYDEQHASYRSTISIDCRTEYRLSFCLTESIVDREDSASVSALSIPFRVHMYVACGGLDNFVDHP